MFLKTIWGFAEVGLQNHKYIRFVELFHTEKDSLEDRFGAISKITKKIKVEEAVQYAATFNSNYTSSFWEEVLQYLEFIVWVYDDKEWRKRIRVACFGKKLYLSHSVYWGFNGAEPTKSGYSFEKRKASRPPRGQCGSHIQEGVEVSPDSVESGPNIWYGEGFPEKESKLILVKGGYGNVPAKYTVLRGEVRRNDKWDHMIEERY